MEDRKVYLIREYQALCPGGVCKDLLTEDEKRAMVENEDVYLTGIMQVCNTLNGNGRIYNRDILMREFRNYQRLVDDYRAVGELDHPESSVINLSDSSHLVVQQWWDGDNWMGKIKLLNTPKGLTAKALVNDGVKLGISSRALGSVTEDMSGRTLVNDDLQMIGFDLVSEPSSPGAFMQLREVTQKELKMFMENNQRTMIERELTKLQKIDTLLKGIV